MPDNPDVQHGYTAFAPHFMHRKCPNRDMASEECRANCLHHGRYCAYDSIADEFSAKFKPHQVMLDQCLASLVATISLCLSLPVLPVTCL